MAVALTRRSIVRPSPSPAHRPGVVVYLLAAAVLVATMVPLGYVVYSVYSVGWAQASELVFRARVVDLLRNTISLVALTVPLAVALGVGLAWLVERTDLPGARLWAPIFVIPLAVPAFVNSFAWVSFVPGMHGLPAAVLVSLLSYFPLVYLPAAAAIRTLDPDLEESARSLGSGSVAVFFRVVVPQLRLAVLGGALLIALHLLAEYGAFALIRFDTFTTAIFQQYQSTFAGSAGSMLAAVLVVCCLVLLVSEAGMRGRLRYDRVGSGSPRPAVRVRLGRFKAFAFIACGVAVAMSVGVPVWMVSRWLEKGGTQAWDAESVSAALSQTLSFALVTALLAIVLAFPIAWLSARTRTLFARVAEGSNYVTSSLPGIVTALALVTISIKTMKPLYQTLTLVVVAYLLMYLPRGVVALRSGVAQVPIGLEEASRSLGKGRAWTFFHVTLRLSGPSAAAGAALVFVAVSTELTATLLLAPAGIRTLSTSFWAYSDELDYAHAAPFALIMILLTLPVTYLLFTQTRKAVTR